MSFFFFKRLLQCKEAAISISCLLGQQAIVGFLVYYSVQVSQKIANGTVQHEDFVILVVLYISPYFPGILGAYMSRLWFLRVIEKFWDDDKGTIAKATTPKGASVYVSQGKETLQNFIDFLYDGISVFLNFVVSAILVGAVLQGSIFVAFTIGFVITFTVYMAFKRLIVKTGKEQTMMSALMVETLTKVLPNFLSGNDCNRDIWRQLRQKSFKAYQHNYRTYEWIRYGLILTTTIFSFLLVAFVLIYSLFDGSNEAHIIALIINLPRIFQIVNSSTQFVQVMQSFYATLGSMKIFDVFGSTLKGDPRHFVTPFKIRINGHAFQDTDAMQGFIEEKSRGFYEITGENGSGKSSFLHVIKKKEGLYFSPRTRLLWPVKLNEGLSDGEYCLAVLNWILDDTQGPLLLDEWDAFLSGHNLKYIKERLLKRALLDKVISVSHRSLATIERGGAVS